MSVSDLQKLFNLLDDEIREIRFEGMYTRERTDMEDRIKHTKVSWEILMKVFEMFDLEKYFILGLVKHTEGEIPHTLPAGWLVEVEDDKGNFFYKKVACI
mgnify:CR=1 FL=1